MGNFLQDQGCLNKDAKIELEKMEKHDGENEKWKRE